MPQSILQLKNKRVLITGGAGFAGSNLVHRLSQEGCQLTVIDNFHPDYGGNELNLKGVNNLTLVKGDITDVKLMNSLVRETDLTFHLAAQCSHVDSMRDPWLDLKYNCEGTLVLLEAAKLAKNLSPIVYISTRATLGAPLENPATEKTLPNPTDVYGVNKLAAEYYGAVYARVSKIPFVTVRLTNCYGPRHQMKHGKYGILNWFIRLALQNETIKVYGTGSQLRDYLYIDDAVEALVLSAEHAEKIRTLPVPNALFNIVSGKQIPFVDCAKKIVDACGSGKIEMVPWPEDRKAIETGDFIADSSFAQKELKFQPKTQFDAGLKTTIDFYRTHLNQYL